MAYDEGLAVRIREVFSDVDTVSVERSMFGGLAFMVGGHMTVGVVGDDLMVRVGPAHYEEAQARPGVRAMDFTGRPMTGMVFVSRTHLDDDVTLREWIRRGLAFTTSLPPK